MLLLLENNLYLRIISSDLIAPLINLFAAFCLFYAAKRSAYNKRIQLAWTILALAQLSYAIGDVIWAFIEVGLGQQPFPSVADVFYVIYYPLFAIGIFFLPRISGSRKELLNTFLDMLIVFISFTLIFWTFLIAPLLETSSGTFTAVILSLYYIVMDFILLFVLFDLLLNKIKSWKEGSLVLLAIGIGSFVITDVYFAYQSLQGVFVSGSLMETGWIFGGVFIAMTGIFQATKKQQISTKKSLKMDFHRKNLLGLRIYHFYGYLLLMV